ncbi:MAG TPA: carnitine dehydratase [Microbacterium sp.]|uniref:CaiB/BaiF CoA transferase family protein n=1 Tax=unclassified Microbacterium TaxID=2609290 RepID=UPI000E88DF93|nr:MULTISPECIES: CoA transferase [unclassified Microbacterium]HBS09516.1 carnitine dehydratase [Microbacterium sp.]|tara:strand:+ start:7203 stop:8399 length:1197 start_codon:yes stop_codon:yes gene_type:complete
MVTANETGPLRGVRVLAIENFLSGPYGSMLLADFGAEVIKVEPPEGDGYRRATPNYETAEGRMSYSFLRINRNKHSVVLDLKSAEGKEAFLRLVDEADVVWENLRPGAMDRLGLGWSQLRERNPRLVYASISGFGHGDVLPRGPYADLPAFDIVAQAMSGMMTRVGEAGQPPLYLGAPVADQLAGVMAAFGVVLALRGVDATGEGQHVDIAMYDVMVALNEQSVGHYAHFGVIPERGLSPTSAPYGAFRAKDGWFAVGIASDWIWARFCVAIERPDLVAAEGLRTGMERSSNQDLVLRPLIEEWASALTPVEAASVLTAAGVPAAPVQDVADLFSDPQVAAREMLATLHDPVVGELKVAGNPVKLGGHPHIPTRTAPQLGADQQLLEGTRERAPRATV